MNRWDIPKEQYGGPGGFLCIKESVPDSKRLYLRKGDIVKFRNGKIPEKDFRDWFLTKEDKKKYIKRYTRPPFKVPKYAMNQYAIVVNRYKITKHKYMIFRDYGCLLMILTGDNIGRIKNYYGAGPFIVVSKYPYFNPDGGFYVKMKKPFRVVGKNWMIGKQNISDNIPKLLSLYEDNEKSRDLFLSNIYSILESEEMLWTKMR